MEEEDLDWGDTEITQSGIAGPADDADDGVSLGSDSGDEVPNEFVPASVVTRSSPGAALTTAEDFQSDSPKSSARTHQDHTLQRESSSNSLNSVKRNDSSSTASPKSRNRRSKSSSLPTPKVIHGLPAKPVVTNVPFLPPSHPSLTEATRISEGGKNKTNSNANKSTPTKPVSSDVEGSLPRDWEIRHPRSGDRDAIYYYNTRTHQSTWTRPDSHSSSRPEDPEPGHSRADLSYEDRHYRPTADSASDNDAATSRNSRRGAMDSWFGSTNEDRPDSSPSPTRARNRSNSPSQRREHASGRRNRPSQHNGRGQRHANSDRDRDSSVLQENDRVWRAPPEGNASSVVSEPHKSRKSQRNSQNYPDEPPSSYDTYPEREKSDHSHSRRSPPHTRESRRQEHQDNLPPSTHSGKRDRPSRFAPPAPVLDTQDNDEWVPDEFKTSTSAPSTGLNRRDRGLDRHEDPPNVTGTEPPLASRNQYDDTTLTSSSYPPGPVSEQSQQPTSRRKRAPLPPQSMSFRELGKSGIRGSGALPNIIVGPVEPIAAAHHSPSSNSPKATTHSPSVSSHGRGPLSQNVPRQGHGDKASLVRDLPPHQMQQQPQNLSQQSRASKFGPPSQNVEHDVPPHHQLRDGRDKDRERDRGDRDHERDRDRPKDTRDGGRERGRGRDRGERRDRRRDRDLSIADDRSTTSSSRRPTQSRHLISRSRSRSRSRSLSADPSMRLGREPDGGESVRMGISMPLPAEGSAPPPAHASAPRGPRGHGGSGHRPASPPVSMYPNRRGRSPSVTSPISRDDRYDPPRDGPRASKDEMLIERGAVRGRARGRASGRGNPPLPLSGTNNIPVGTRPVHGPGPDHRGFKAPQNHYNEHPLPSPSGFSGANMVPMKNARSRYGPNHEPADYEGPSGPKGVYPPEPEGSNHGKPMPSVYEREDDDRRGSNRPRRHSFTDEDTRQRSSYPEGENRSQWSPQSPQDHHYNSTNNFRSGSTPPASRERSHAEQRDRDHASDYGRRRHRSPERRRHDEPDLDENVRRPPELLPSNGHRPHGLPMKPTTQLPPDISDRHYRPRRRSSVDASDGLREQPQVERRRRPNSPPPAHLPERPRMEEPSRSSKPVKIRRPPSSQNQSSYERERERDAPQYNGNAMADRDVAMDDYTGAGPSDIEGDRPRHGGSLLDRLGGVDASRDYQQHTSLKDRVNVPAKRDLDEMDGHNRYSGEAAGDQGSTAEDFSSKRAKKRHSKPKRGRPRGAGGASVYP